MDENKLKSIQSGSIDAYAIEFEVKLTGHQRRRREEVWTVTSPREVRVSGVHRRKRRRKRPCPYISNGH